MNRLKKPDSRTRINLKQNLLTFTSIVMTVVSPQRAYSSEPTRRTWISMGGELDKFKVTGEEVSRSGTSFMNLNFNYSYRIHPDLWLGMIAFLGHDNNPEVGRNYDTSLGLILHWFPLSLTSDSSLYTDGIQISEREVFRPFVSVDVASGRAVVKQVIKLDQSADYVGFGFGAGLQYWTTSSFAISSSLGVHANIGTSQMQYSGRRTSLAFSGLLAL